MYRNLAVVQQKIYSYLTRLKNVAFHANFFYALRQRGPHHVVCLRAPTILNPPLLTIMEYGHSMRFWEKMGKFNYFPRFRTLFGIIIGAMALENIREVRWHVVSIVFFLNFCGETA